MILDERKRVIYCALELCRAVRAEKFVWVFALRQSDDANVEAVFSKNVHSTERSRLTSRVSVVADVAPVSKTFQQRGLLCGQ